MKKVKTPTQLRTMLKTKTKDTNLRKESKPKPRHEQSK